MHEKGFSDCHLQTLFNLTYRCLLHSGNLGTSKRIGKKGRRLDLPLAGGIVKFFHMQNNQHKTSIASLKIQVFPTDNCSICWQRTDLKSSSFEENKKLPLLHTISTNKPLQQCYSSFQRALQNGKNTLNTVWVIRVTSKNNNILFKRIKSGFIFPPN